MSIPVVPQDRIPPKLPYPYLTYKFIVPYTQFRHQGNYTEEFAPSLDPRFEFDVEEKLVLQPQMTLSVNAYFSGGQDDQMEAYEVAKKAMNWFKHIGYQDLIDINMVVVSVEAFGDRTILITDHYEARVGFDVIMRTVDVINRRYETIEDNKINTEID